MIKYTQKQLRAMVADGIAENSTNADNNVREELEKKKAGCGRLVIPLAYMDATECCYKVATVARFTQLRHAQTQFLFSVKVQRFSRIYP